MNTRMLLGTGSAFAMALAANLFTATPALADDCLLDRDNSGDVSVIDDNDGGADSGGDDTRLACGVGARASGVDSTALGRAAFAQAIRTIAVGSHSSALGADSTALGAYAEARADRLRHHRPARGRGQEPPPRSGPRR